MKEGNEHTSVLLSVITDQRNRIRELEKQLTSLHREFTRAAMGKYDLKSIDATQVELARLNTEAEAIRAAAMGTTGVKLDRLNHSDDVPATRILDNDPTSVDDIQLDGLDS